MYYINKYMYYIIFITNFILSGFITYLWYFGSRFYIELSRSYASSSYPGDITASQKLIYLFLFPGSLLIVLLIVTFIFNKIVFINSKEEAVRSSLLKKIPLYIIPIICTIIIFVYLYLFIY